MGYKEYFITYRHRNNQLELQNCYKHLAGLVLKEMYSKMSVNSG